MNEKNLTQEEQQLLGLVQKQMLETVENVLKGVDPVEIKKQVDAINDTLSNKDQVSAEVEERLNKAEEQLETINSLAQEIADLKNDGVPQDESVIEKSLNSVLESDRFKSLANGTAKTSGQHDLILKNRDMILKTVSTASHTGSVYGSVRSDVIESNPRLRKLRLRDFMNVVDASDEEFTSFYFLEVYDIDRAAVATSENGTLPEGSFKTRESVAETKRIGWHIPLSKRMLRKIAILRNYILELLPNGMDRAENFQLLFGDNETPNFKGIVEVAQSHTNLTGTVYSIEKGEFELSSYANGAKTLVTFTNPLPKMETGMSVTFAAATGTDAAIFNKAHEIVVMNDKNIVINLPSPSVTLTNATAEIKNMWGSFIPNANAGDGLRSIASYLNFGEFMPNAFAMSAITFAGIQGMKDDVGNNISSDFIQVIDGIPYLDGIYPIALIDAIPKGYVLCGDFQNGCILFDTQAGYVEFAEDVSTKLANKVVALIQEEVVFAITCPDAFMYAKLDNVVNTINVATTKAVNVSIVSPLNDDGDAVKTDSGTVAGTGA